MPRANNSPAALGKLVGAGVAGVVRAGFRLDFYARPICRVRR